MSTNNTEALSMLELLEEMVDNRLTANNEGPLHASLSKGDDNSRLLVMVGDNAGGKSLLIRFAATLLNQQNTEPLQVSMRYRTQSGIHRVFMFGDEQEDSTGAVSLNAVEGALCTAKGRETPCWVMLDEPDIGLSDSYSRALGKYLAEHGNALPEKQFEALVVVTHSKTLVESLFEHTNLRPHFIAVGENQVGQSPDGWLADKTERSVEELLKLHEKGTQTWRAVNAVFKNKN